MKKIHSAFAVVSVLAIGGCSPHVDMDAERAAISKFHDECLTKMLAGDVDCFAEDGQMLPLDATAIKGRGAIGQLVSQMIEDPNFSVSHDIINVDISRSGDQAYIHYAFEMIMSDPDGNRVAEQGKAIYILEKQPQVGWKILIDASKANDESETDENAETEAVRARSDGIVGAEAALDVEGSLAFFAEDAIVQPADGPQIRGHDAIAGMYRRFFEGSQLIEFSAKGSHVSLSKSGDLAYEYGANRAVLAGSEGDLVDVGKYLLVWKKIDGEWMVVVLTYSSDTPAPTLVGEQ
jgi:ketosteroid isomerase-like protein